MDLEDDMKEETEEAEEGVGNGCGGGGADGSWLGLREQRGRARGRRQIGRASCRERVSR